MSNMRAIEAAVSQRDRIRAAANAIDRIKALNWLFAQAASRGRVEVGELLAFATAADQFSRMITTDIEEAARALLGLASPMSDAEAGAMMSRALMSDVKVTAGRVQAVR